MDKVLFSSKSDEWATSQALFDKINSIFHFTLDVCADSNNAKCKKYFTKEQDGLTQDWGSEIVWCNPPYGREIGKWVEACACHPRCSVMLLPARTDTKWFHEWIYGNNNAELYFIKGRLRFGKAKYSAPFPPMVVVFNYYGIEDYNSDSMKWALER